MRFRLAVVVFALAAVFAGNSRAAGVDLNVVLAADVSGSVDQAEFALQRQGYAAALSDPHVLSAVRAGPNKAIAISFIEFSGDADQKIIVPWTILKDQPTAQAIAGEILESPRAFMGRTSISGAIDFALQLFRAAKWRAGRKVIDISGDGTSNSGPALAQSRRTAIADGVTINGLAIVNDLPGMQFSIHTHPPGGLPHYYGEQVIGGPGAFLIIVKNFRSFAKAMAKKLAREINVAEGRPPTLAVATGSANRAGTSGCPKCPSLSP